MTELVVLEQVLAWAKSDREQPFPFTEVECALAALTDTKRIADCAGGSPCTACPDKSRCGKTGCIRQPEFVGSTATEESRNAS